MARAILIIGVGALLVGLIIYAIIDCIRTDHSRVKTLPKPAWMLIIIFFPVVGALLWLFAGKSRYTSSFGPVAPRQTPKAPDDDEDYLRYLGNRSKRQAQQRRQEEEREAELNRRLDEELRKKREKDGGPAASEGEGGSAGGPESPKNSEGPENPEPPQGPEKP